MPTGLSVARVISVSINLSPVAAAFANFDSCLIIGNSNVINTIERIRSYNGIAAVVQDFATTTPEYLAGVNFFSQVPTPDQLYIGRWAQASTKGLILGGPLTTAQQSMALWQAVTNGGFKIGVDGGAATNNVTGLNFSAAANLNAVAVIIQAAVQLLGGAFAAVTCVWDSVRKQFVITSGTTGAASTVAALVAPTAGTDISVGGFLTMTAATLQLIVPGIVAETALACVTIMDNLATQFYGLMFASTSIVDADHLAIAAFIEADGTNSPHLYGLTTSAAAAIISPDTTSIGAQLKALLYNRTFYQWSSSSLYAVASIFGRGVTVNFGENNSVITFMWKQEPGVAAESLTASQADALNSNNYNYFANFNNNTAIVVNGKVASGAFIDEIWDLDWFGNQIQTDVYNLLYTSATKIPQTDAGMNMIKNAIEAACVAAVNNGTLAPGTWTLQGFGQLSQGDFLTKGYYVFAPPVSSQAPADRAARKSVPFQVAAKLAGAVHSVAITVNVNR